MKILNYMKQEKYVTAQRRVLLMGPPKWGKTWSALTAPNPIVADFDRGLAGYPNEVYTIPFYDTKWVMNTFKIKWSAESFLKWLQTDALQLDKDQTVIVDSLSTLSDALTVELDAKTPLTRQGEKDSFWFWRAWSQWLCDMCNAFTRLQANVILITHEQEIRDSETGKVLGYKWLLKGQDFPPRMSQFFTDVIRQTKRTEELKGKVKETFLWQIKPDSLFPLLCTRYVTEDKFVPANWSAIEISNNNEQQKEQL